MDKQHIFFDLDGTLIDSSKGIFYCIDYAFEKMNLQKLPYETKLKFIGPPLLDSFMDFCGLSYDDAAKCYSYFREMYEKKGVLLTELYDGVADMLKKLYMSGKSIYTATSKPEKFAKIILKEHGVDKYFTDIAGASLDRSRVTKIDVLDYALKKQNITNMDKCVLVGDRCFDVEGAHLANIDCIGILWGFGDKLELEKAGSEFIAETTDEVVKCVCGGQSDK